MSAAGGWPEHRRTLPLPQPVRVGKGAERRETRKGRRSLSPPPRGGCERLGALEFRVHLGQQVLRVIPGWRRADIGSAER